MRLVLDTKALLRALISPQGPSVVYVAVVLQILPLVN
jgi:predicted nucleic acid-binding protein